MSVVHILGVPTCKISFPPKRPRKTFFLWSSHIFK